MILAPHLKSDSRLKIQAPQKGPHPFSDRVDLPSTPLEKKKYSFKHFSVCDALPAKSVHGKGSLLSLSHRQEQHKKEAVSGPVYGALDLGTNCCRLLLGSPSPFGFSVVDSFTRIVRLGEGATASGVLTQPAMDRTLRALHVCASKMQSWNVQRFRLVATQACRFAKNAPDFIEKIARETGLTLEIVARETEAYLAVASAFPLVSRTARRVLLFDIGGGSTELVWLHITPEGGEVAAWSSLPFGVVTLTELFPQEVFSSWALDAMRSHIRPAMVAFAQTLREQEGEEGLPDHLLGTSGTITTVCGVHLGLGEYHRSAVDGQWLTLSETRAALEVLSALKPRELHKHPCVGPQRADLSLAGCAILSEILDQWPAPHVRVGDRGLKEGILTSLMHEDGTYGQSFSTP